MKKYCKRIWKFVFVIYSLILLKLIVFKYPLHYLWDIMATWEKGVILEGLATANFTLGKSIRMYIKYFNKFFHKESNNINDFLFCGRAWT